MYIVGVVITAVIDILHGPMICMVMVPNDYIVIIRNYNMNLEVIHSLFDELLLLSLRITDLYPHGCAQLAGSLLVPTILYSACHEIILHGIHMQCICLLYTSDAADE